MVAKAVARRTRARRGEGERLREEILEATERLLVRKGDVDAVSIRDIADEVGCTSPSIYIHFEDKDALVFAVCERMFTALRDVARQAEAGVSDPLEVVRRMGRAYVRFGLSHPEQYRILFMSRDPRATASLLERVREVSGFDALIAAVERCIEAGAFRPGDPFTIACVLWMGVHGITSLLISKPSFPWPTELIEESIETYCRGLAP